jgi:hypothetical protein
MSKNFDIKNPDFAICEITMQSEPSDQALIWTVDSSQWRGIGDRELDMTKIIGTPISRYVKSRCNLSRQIKL